MTATPEPAGLLDELRAVARAHRERRWADRAAPWARACRMIREDPGWLDDPEVADALEFMESLSAEQRKAVARLRRQVQAGLREAEEGEGAPCSGALRDLGCPVPDGVELERPAGYVIRADGVWQEGDDPRQVARAPVAVVGLVRDVQTDDRHLEVAWRTWGGWRTAVLPRADVASRRQLVTYAARGFPVDDTTAGDCVRYLAAFESTNEGRLPHGKSSSVFGWQEGGRSGFLWGSTCIGGEVRFLGADDGDTETAESYRRSGTLRRWVADLWETVASHPRVALGVYAAVAPVLLGIVDEASGFVVDWSGRTTGGKTTTLRVAASVWGPPDGYFQWNSTTVGAERLAALHAGMPLLLDDTKQVDDRHRDMIGRVLYMVTGVRGRVRGSKTGLQATAKIRTVLLSTGEKPATHFGNDAGARARTLSIRGFPLDGGDTEDNRKTAEYLNVAALDDHGQVGPAVVEWLLRHRGEWSGLRDRWRTYRDEYAEGLSGVAGRSAPYLATLRLAGEIVEEATGARYVGAVLDEAQHWAQRSAADADVPLAALCCAYDMTAAHTGDVASSPDSRPHRLVGRWYDDDEGPALVPTALSAWLAEHGYDLDDVADEWARRGWLVTRPHADGGTRKTITVRMGKDVRARAYQLTGAATLAAREED